MSYTFQSERATDNLSLFRFPSQLSINLFTVLLLTVAHNIAGFVTINKKVHMKTNNEIHCKTNI